MSAMDVISLFVYYIVVYNIALLYGTVGEIVTEKSGSMNLGVEGTMAVGAIGGYLMGCLTDNLYVGILASFVFAGLCGLLFAWLTISMQANQNVTGLTITTFGLGLYFFIGKGIGKAWPVMQQKEHLLQQVAEIRIPGLADIPIIGKGFFHQNILVYLGFLIAIAMWFYMNKTKLGLRMRAIGENPAAADAVGINIKRYKYIHVVLGAGIMGIGGYQMGLNLGGTFEGSNCWINGYGWIAIALVIFANWNTAKAILGTLVFGFFNTLQVYGSALAETFPKALGFLNAIPAQVYQALPFLITAIVLIFNSVKKNKTSGQPAATGINYYREDR